MLRDDRVHFSHIVHGRHALSQRLLLGRPKFDVSARYEKAESLRSGQLRLRRSPNQQTSELTALVGTPRARHEVRGKI